MIDGVKVAVDLIREGLLLERVGVVSEKLLRVRQTIPIGVGRVRIGAMLGVLVVVAQAVAVAVSAIGGVIGIGVRLIGDGVIVPVTPGSQVFDTIVVEVGFTVPPVPRPEVQRIRDAVGIIIVPRAGVLDPVVPKAAGGEGI